MVSLRDCHTWTKREKLYHSNCTKGQKFISELSTNAPALDKKLTVRTVRLRSPFTLPAGIVWGMVGDRGYFIPEREGFPGSAYSQYKDPE